MKGGKPAGGGAPPPGAVGGKPNGGGMPGGPPGGNDPNGGGAVATFVAGLDEYVGELCESGDCWC